MFLQFLPKPPLTPEQEEQVCRRLEAGSTSEDQVCSLRGVDIQRILATEFGVLRSLPATYHLLHRLGYSYLRPRPRHRLADPAHHCVRPFAVFLADGNDATVGQGRDDQRGAVVIGIQDSGIGIARDALQKLGRPFEQVESQLTKTHHGSGLGLAIAKSLIELHGGEAAARHLCEHTRLFALAESLGSVESLLELLELLVALAVSFLAACL